MNINQLEHVYIQHVKAENLNHLNYELLPNYFEENHFIKPTI